MADDSKIADRIAEMAPGWLPISGHVVNVTLTLNERDQVVTALRDMASERERCAKIAESFKPGFCGDDKDVHRYDLAERIAAQIRGHG